MLQAAAPFSTSPIHAHAALPHQEAYSHIYAGMQMLEVMMIAFERTGDCEDSTTLLMKGFEKMIQRNFRAALNALDGKPSDEGDEA